MHVGMALAAGIMMGEKPAPVLVNFAFSNSTTAQTSAVVTLPSPIKAGDTLVMQLVTFSGGVTTPSGWTNNGGNGGGGYEIYSKVATGTEGSSIAVSITSGAWNAQVIQVRGGNATNPIQAFAITSSNASASSTQMLPPVSATSRETLYLAFANWQPGSGGAGQSISFNNAMAYQTSNDTAISGGYYSILACACKTLYTPGSAGATTATCSASLTQSISAAMIITP
jgi:hypothetical protein